MSHQADRRLPRRRTLVQVRRATRLAPVPRGAEWERWAREAGATDLGQVTVVLVGDAASRRLNQRFRRKAGPTNVLAFPAGVPDELGDLVICLPLVHREARTQGKKPLHHLAHLFVHGILHLIGHEHDEQAAARKMEKAEVAILRRLGFPDPYQAAVSCNEASRRRKQR